MQFRVLIPLVLTSGVLLAASGRPTRGSLAKLVMDGRSLFLACEFKEAARTFERGLADQPESAFLYYWAGKSYARLAEVSSSFSAPKNAHKARRNLERAVQLDPDNREYLQELFEFYLESPGWFRGGLNRAAALQERVATSNLLTNIGRRNSLPLDTSTVVQHGGKRQQFCVLMEPLDL
jgi:tetratricopeptide (TPR) repeat protein